MDDDAFCRRLLDEELVFLLPGRCFGLKNFARAVICAPQPVLADACDRIERFCDKLFAGAVPAPARPPRPVLPTPAPLPAAPAPAPAAVPAPAADKAEKGKAVERVQKDLAKTLTAAAPAPVVGTAGEAKFTGRSWLVEGAGSGQVDVAVEKTQHAVAVVKCGKAVVRVKGKCAALQLSNCKNTVVHVEDVVGTVEVSNCQRCKVFVSGLVSSISVDKTDGILLNLSDTCVDSVSITGASSSEMNVAFSKDGEMVECPLPEQFVHKLVEAPGLKPKIVSKVSSIYEA